MNYYDKEKQSQYLVFNIRSSKVIRKVGYIGKLEISEARGNLCNYTRNIILFFQSNLFLTDEVKYHPKTNI